MQTLRGRPYPDPGVDVMNTDSRDFWRGEAVWTIVSCQSFQRCWKDPSRPTGGQVVTSMSRWPVSGTNEATASPGCFNARGSRQACNFLSVQVFSV